MGFDLEWLREQRGTRDEPEWAKSVLSPRCPTELVVTAVRVKRIRVGQYKWKDQTIWQECEIELATEWHWETREKGQDDG